MQTDSALELILDKVVGKAGDLVVNLMSFPPKVDAHNPGIVYVPGRSVSESRRLIKQGSVRIMRLSKDETRQISSITDCITDDDIGSVIAVGKRSIRLIVKS